MGTRTSDRVVTAARLVGHPAFVAVLLLTVAKISHLITVLAITGVVRGTR